MVSFKIECDALKCQRSSAYSEKLKYSKISKESTQSLFDNLINTGFHDLQFWLQLANFLPEGLMVRSWQFAC